MSSTIEGPAACGWWRQRFALLALATLVALAIVPASSGAALAQGAPAKQDNERRYALGPLDRVRVTVSEWRPEAGLSRDWSTMNGEYAVDAGGRLSLPYIGALDVAGRDTHEVAAEIGPLLQSRLGLAQAPGAAVEIVSYRPFFVSGHVARPGMYPFMPDLNVAMALAIAGGLPRAATHGAEPRDNTLVKATGAIALLRSERHRLEARRARLIAERDDLDAIAFPGAVAASPDAAELLRSERALLAARRDKLARRLASLGELATLLEAELASLERKLETQRRAEAAAREELKGVSRLARKGLAINTQVRGINQVVAQAETNILTIETDMLRVRQELIRAAREGEVVRGEFRTELAAALEDTTARLRETAHRLDLQRRIASASLPAASSPATGVAPVPRFVVLRGTGADATRIDVSPQAALQPGDVLDVELIVPPTD